MLPAVRERDSAVAESAPAPARATARTPDAPHMQMGGA